MGMFDKLIDNLKASKKTIVFTVGTDERILWAADKLLSSKFIKVRGLASLSWNTLIFILGFSSSSSRLAAQMGSCDLSAIPRKSERSISGFTFSILKKYLRWFFCVPHSADIQQTAYPNKHMLPPY